MFLDNVMSFHDVTCSVLVVGFNVKVFLSADETVERGVERFKEQWMRASKVSSHVEADERDELYSLTRAQCDLSLVVFKVLTQENKKEEEA